MKKIKVAVLYGGISSEHKISCLSARSVLKNLDKEKFEVAGVKIPQDGKIDIAKIQEADVILPILHGVGGEDGSIQGLCEVLKKPYAGSGIGSSALALDKVRSKLVWKEAGLPVPGFIYFEKNQWQGNFLQIMKKIKPPVFIKPANTGSSIGISKVEKSAEIRKAVNKALEYDKTVIVEEALKDIREIEVSVLGNDELIVSLPGEIIPADKFYSFRAKYKLSSTLVIPAEISKEKILEIQDLAQQAFRLLGCKGFARVDFFLQKKTDKVCLNEINSIPGFTHVSMFPKLMEASGIPYKDLLTKIVYLALE